MNFNFFNLWYIYFVSYFKILNTTPSMIFFVEYAKHSMKSIKCNDQ